MTETRGPSDFGGQCLIGECRLEPGLLLPTTTYLGTVKEGSYLYGTWRDEDGNLLRALRGVGADSSTMRHLFAAVSGGQLARVPDGDHDLWAGPVTIEQRGDAVHFTGTGDGVGARFEWRDDPAGCEWRDGTDLEVSGRSLGPALQWFSTWDGGACLSASAKYRSSGTFRGRPVEGFVGHEIHFFSAGASWFASPFGAGREICWQQIANEYEDGTVVHGTLAYGTDGWGFAMLRDEHGFRATTSVELSARVRDNGYPEEITYAFMDEAWVWRIDPQGERDMIVEGSALRGADGTCTKVGDTRRVVHSMGNSDWWTDGRADAIVVS